MIDLLTVVFQEELVLLKLQAKSIDTYIDCIDKIYVIVNDDAHVASLIDKSWWGIHESKVSIILASQLAPDPNLIGWSSQQLYKLLGSAQSKSDYVMVLDAKTWFVTKLDQSKIFENNKINFRQTPVPAVFKSAKNYTEEIYKIQIPAMIGPGGVPFIFKVSDLREMIAGIELQFNESFYSFFKRSLRAPPDLTEFMLYTGFIIKKYGSLLSCYNNNQYYKINNISHDQTKNVDILFDRIKNKNTLTISMHRKAYCQLTELQFDKWCNIVSYYKLTPDVEITKKQLNTLR